MSTIFSPKDPASGMFALVQQYNALHDSVMSGTYVHRDQSAVASGTFPYFSSSVLTSTATGSLTTSNLATFVALTNDIRGCLMVHFADDSAHSTKDLYGASGVTMLLNSLSAITASSDQNSMWSTLNFLSGAFVQHMSSSVHQNSDLQPLSGVLANDVSSCKTFAKSLQTAVNHHFKDGPVVGRIKQTD